MPAINSGDVGRSPWTAADTLVGFVSGIRKGSTESRTRRSGADEGRPPHKEPSPDPATLEVYSTPTFWGRTASIHQEPEN